MKVVGVVVVVVVEKRHPVDERIPSNIFLFGETTPTFFIVFLGFHT